MFGGHLRFKISEKWANLRFPLNIQKQKVFRLTPDQGLCPWTPLAALPPNPRYRLALRALAMAPSLPNPKYTTERSRFLFICSYSYPVIKKKRRVVWPQDMRYRRQTDDRLWQRTTVSTVGQNAQNE